MCADFVLRPRPLWKPPTFVAGPVSLFPLAAVAAFANARDRRPRGEPGARRGRAAGQVQHGSAPRRGPRERAHRAALARRRRVAQDRRSVLLRRQQQHPAQQRELDHQRDGARAARGPEPPLHRGRAGLLSAVVGRPDTKQAGAGAGPRRERAARVHQRRVVHARRGVPDLRRHDGQHGAGRPPHLRQLRRRAKDDVADRPVRPQRLPGQHAFVAALRGERRLRCAHGLPRYRAAQAHQVDGDVLGAVALDAQPGRRARVPAVLVLRARGI